MKFIFVSCLVSIIQLVLVNVPFFVTRQWKAPLPGFLAAVFTPSTVGAGNDNRGCALPFFLSNLIANIYGYFQNQKTAFQASDTPAWCMWYYFGVIAALILFSTWLQGVLASRALNSGIGILSGLAPMLAAFAAGNVQIPVLFPLEKFVLFKEQRK